jgi:putative ABC transport system permease protein
VSGAGAWFEQSLQDLRHAVRRLRRNPGFTAAAVITLALGIGANTAIFSVIDGVLLRPLPFADARRLVLVWETDRNSGTTREPGSWPDYLDFARRTHALDGMAALMGQELTLTPASGEPARLAAMGASAGFFPLVGVHPILGRLFTDREDRPGVAPVVILGEATWRSRFGADPGIVGRDIRINDAPYTVIGVVPQGAGFGLDQIHARAAYHATYVAGGRVDAWVPLQAAETDFPRSTHPFLLLGRLAPGVTVAAAQREMAEIAADLEHTYPQANDARGVHVEPLTQVVFGSSRPMLLLILGAVALVLLVACVNVANLLLARGATRAREVAVRGALGAGRGRLARQVVTEAVVLALAGGLAGVAVAFGGLGLLLSVAPADIPRVAEVGINLRVLLATLAVSVLVGVGFGLAPMVQAFHVDIMHTIRGGGAGGSGDGGARRFRELLVVAELALSVVLAVGAGLLIRSFWSVLNVDPGFSAAGVVKAEYQLPESRYPRDYRKWPAWPEVHAFDRALLDRVRAIPGVEAAALAGAGPLDPGFTNSFVVVGRESEARDWPEISVRVVSSGYLGTLGVRLARGRPLEDGDDATAAAVAVINQAAVRRFFRDQDPLGQEIRFWGTSRRIVGVTEDELIHGLTEPAPPAVYLPLGQAPRSAIVFARTGGDPRDLEEPLRQAIWTVDRELAVYGVEPLEDTLKGSISQRRFAVLVLGAFAAVTFLLALVGIHGVLSYTTSQRTREIGIRLALGSTGSGVTGLVMRGGFRLAVIGTVLGLAGATLGSRLLGGLVYGIPRLDPRTFVVVAVGAIGAALFATWLPARRAARVQPMSCLRAE